MLRVSCGNGVDIIKVGADLMIYDWPLNKDRPNYEFLEFLDDDFVEVEFLENKYMTFDSSQINIMPKFETKLLLDENYIREIIRDEIPKFIKNKLIEKFPTLSFLWK